MNELLMLVMLLGLGRYSSEDKSQRLPAALSHQAP